MAIVSQLRSFCAQHPCLLCVNYHDRIMSENVINLVIAVSYFYRAKNKRSFTHCKFGDFLTQKKNQTMLHFND